MVGRLTLNQVILVRIQVRQLFNFHFVQISESATSRHLREVFDYKEKIEDTEEQGDEVFKILYL